MAAVLAIALFMLMPISLYMGNRGEFITPLASLLRWWAIPAVATLLMLVVIGMFCPLRWHGRYLVLLACLSLLAWFQGQLLVWDYGPLDGRNIDWPLMTWRGWVDGAIWLGVVWGGLVCSRKVGQLIIQAALLLFVVQSAQVLLLVFSVDERLEQSANELATLEQISGFSQQQNVLHLLLDGFQSDFFDELIRDAQIGDHYRESMQGFTFYPETIGVFPYTRFAVPAFLTGQIYDNQQVKNEFIAAAIAGDSLFNAASAAGMELDVASMEYWAPFYAKADVTHSYVIPEGGHSSAFDFKLANTTKLLDLALFRVSPHFLKQKIYNNQRWLLGRITIDVEYLQFHYFSHTQFLNDLIDGMAIGRSKPTYKFFHVMNTHNPMVVDANCHYVGGALPTNRATLLMQSKCTLDTVLRLFDKLKQMGLYENTLIVMHGDHGGWVPHRNYQPEQVNRHHQVPYWAVSLGSPLLAIKPPGSSGPLISSARLASLLDIADTVADLMQWPQSFGGKSLVGSVQDDFRKRYFYNYAWQQDAWESEYAGPIQEYEIVGKHYQSPWVPKRVFTSVGQSE